jgi:hypothetical protein
MNTKSQKVQIHNFLKSGKELTALDALRKFGCLRLAARIADLRDEGVRIISTPKVLRTGKRVVSYSLG